MPFRNTRRNTRRKKGGGKTSSKPKQNSPKKSKSPRISHTIQKKVAAAKNKVASAKKKAATKKKEIPTIWRRWGGPAKPQQADITKRWMEEEPGFARGATKRGKKGKKGKTSKKGKKGKKRPLSPWQKHLMKVFREMKTEDKTVKLGDAMREAKKSYN